MEVKDPIAGYATNPVVQILRHAVLRKVEKETSPVKLEKMYLRTYKDKLGLQ